MDEQRRALVIQEVSGDLGSLRHRGPIEIATEDLSDCSLDRQITQLVAD